MALHTLSAITLTQLNDGTHKVRVQTTLTDADSDILRLAFQFKHTADSEWLPAIVTGDTVVTGLPGGLALDRVWDLDASSIDTATTANFDFRVIATKFAVPATGTLTAIAANTTNGVETGDTFVIAGRTYEFSTDGDVAPGHVLVALDTAADAAGLVKAAIIDAINTDPDAGVTATSGAGEVINVIAKNPGAAGNVAITEAISNTATLTPVGLVNGADDIAVNASASLVAATTGALTELSDELPAVPATVDTVRRAAGTTKYIHRFETQGVFGKGIRPQDSFKGAPAYSILDALRNGTYDKFELQADRGGAGFRRAVLVSVAEYQRVAGGAGIEPVLKSKQWLSHVAWRALSVTLATDEVYAICEKSFVQNGNRLVEQQTVIAYLLSTVRYETLRG